MGVALGWLAVALAASGPGAPPEETKPQITYRFRMVEVKGLAWRGTGLKPVAQHNAVSVWTTPDDFLDRLPAEAQAVAADPAEVKGPAQAPVHLSTCKSQEFVTQVVWKGKGKAPRPVTESVREGVVATVVGRRIDQGVLAQLVIDDVDVRSVHTIASPTVKQARRPESDAKVALAEMRADAPCPFQALQAAELHHGVSVTVSASMDLDANPDEAAKPVTSIRIPADWFPSKSVAIVKSAAIATRCRHDSACCQASTAGAGAVHACEVKCDEGRTADGKTTPSCKLSKTAAAKTDASTARAGWKASGEGGVQIPEVGRASAAGEWLIPDGEVLVVGFGPHTVADAEGKAVVREHLAVISAEADDDDDQPAAVPTRHEPPAAVPATPERPEAPRTAAALPELPSRSLPQGVHADGTPAALPTLPEDEQPAEPASDESSEPLASPQSRRKPATPASDPEAEAAPSTPEVPKSEAKKTDMKAIKSSFMPALKKLQGLPPLNNLIASGLFPSPFQGAQFLVPLKPLALKLPFNQKLEFELVGRVVNDPEAAAQFFAGN
ncbi:hypothetical protein [Paludisphaera mucosa]|uniref:DUF5666 domain-containing protein n=1 Tax=Paludisphaera mucosa TaxID=3030827 RepID=A0ABT6F8U1_9BACT|nr:hypothetical protein [Paludisphaera mucosa]MDG3004006.1 hypothetical protein [Paludisphaera mucosa]